MDIINTSVTVTHMPNSHNKQTTLCYVQCPTFQQIRKS